MFKKSLLPFLFTLLSLITYSLHAEVHETGAIIIKGTVYDKSNKNPLEYATVMAYSSADSNFVSGGITDQRGYFELYVEAGNYFVTFQFVGYKTQKIDNVEVKDLQSIVNLGKVWLTPDAALLEEVEVRAEKSSMEMTLDKRVFNVGKDVASTSSNAIELLENVPSVTVDVEGNVSLRGDDGVQILIDGKESGMVGLSTQDALRSLQADMVERVEIITNPSVRYDAEGTAGIINIVLKKEKRRGFNGSVDLRAGMPRQIGAGISANYRFNKFNFFGNYDFNNQKNLSDSYIKTTYFDGSYNDYEAGLITPYQISEQETKRNMLRNEHTFRAGVEYDITDNDVISANIMYRTSTSRTDPFISYNDSLAGINKYSTRREDWNSSRPVYEYTLNYMKKLAGKGHELKANVRYFTNQEDEWSDISEVMYVNALATDTLGEIMQKTDVRQAQKNLQASVDYVRPFGRTGKFESGLKYTNRDIHTINNIIQGDTILGEYSYDFSYNEQVAAAYAIAGYEYGRFSGQIGLRAEYTYINTMLLDTLNLYSQIEPQHYMNLFPSGHLNYKLSEKDQLQISYTRRIRRPRYHQMNPFHSFNDNRNIRTGNPNLRPVFTDSYELSYLRFMDKGSLSFTTYYRHSVNTMRRYTWVDTLTNVSYTMPINFGIGNSYGLELVGSLQLFKWWNLNGSFNFFRSILDGEIEGRNYHTDSYNTGGRLVSKFSFKKIFDLQLTGNYRGPHDEPLGRRDAMYWLDLAMSKDLFHGQGTLTLSMRDVFATRGFGGDSWGDGFVQYSTGTWNKRNITLNLNYRINQQKKSKRNMSPDTMEGGSDSFDYGGEE